MQRILVFFISVLFALFGSCDSPKNQSNYEAKTKPEAKYEPVEKFDPNRDAAKDIANAIQEASRVNKRILLDVGGDWCIWCRRLDAFIKEHKAIHDFLQENYIVVKIYSDRKNRNDRVLSVYPPFQGYPHIFVLEKDGKLLYSKDTGELEQGESYSEEKILHFLKEWAPFSKDQK